ncbi:2-amino-4-hydroxy-6-hydroxymethyldihydropteridine diphosphokinase [Aureimonas sp. SK2]|uniref:2-amino-4-hydroxy-6- hydroxymethyldihydropteridine diphosphokinase n=1 Tax=Aureimonas sp. SK2 TaxID=3015992 RepID=UPI0024452047|nr:2-amino-4-hydroxy-6-hydroxymethyldihydropteridine diphosphokinase [Aureimonas sp. SK2]
MTRAYLGLGGNLGDPVKAMRQALHALDADDRTQVVSVTPVYRTPPWGLVEQPPFLNACAAVETRRTPEELLDLCLSIEASLHRDRAVRWGPRTVDLDILDFGGVALHTERLTLPHPRMADRAFVLVPLADLAPGLAVEGVGIAERLQTLDRSGIEPVVTAPDWWRSA